MGRRGGSLVTCLLAALALAAPASAATITPNILGDDYDAAPPDGTCSLREAVQSANENLNFGSCVATDLPYGSDMIVLGDGTYMLTTPPNSSTNEHGNLDIQPGSNVTITHAGSGAAVIDGGSQDSVFNNVGTLTVIGVTIQNGDRSGPGGGIVNVGSLTLRNATLTDNATTAEGPGGAIASSAGGVALTNVTVSGNRSQNGGGGIYMTGMHGLNLTNVTISDNTADSNMNGSGDGGGIWNQSTVLPLLKNTIIDGNIDNSLVPPTASPDCSGTLGSLDNNLIGDVDNPCNFSPPMPMMGDQVGVPAGLEPLDDNGGPTSTHALPLGSLALDAVPLAECVSLTDDQRGYPRPFPAGGDCDVGAYELFTCDGVPLNTGGAFAGCPAPPPPPPPPPPPSPPAITSPTPLLTPLAATATPAPKKCRKGFKLKKGKCKKKKKKKKKRK